MHNTILSSPATPTAESLDALQRCFTHTTLTYKFYWLMALIQKVTVYQETDFPAFELTPLMVSMAWRPIAKHQLGLGPGEAFSRIVRQLRPSMNIPIETSYATVLQSIQSELVRGDSSQLLHSALKQLLVNVPYCFLQPWTGLNREKCIREVNNHNRFDRQCTPYWLTIEHGHLMVHVRQCWVEYLNFHRHDLTSYAMAGLQDFVRKRNPEVQCARFMLNWCIDTDLLMQQVDYWNTVAQRALALGNPLRCIFSQQVIEPDQYRIDHFMPEAFADSERLWSIYPADVSARVSNTGNHFKEMALLMPQLAKSQQQALLLYLQTNAQCPKVVADFEGWKVPLTEIATLPSEQFRTIYERQFQLATSRQFNDVLLPPSASRMACDDSSPASNYHFHAGAQTTIYANQHKKN